MLLDKLAQFFDPTERINYFMITNNSTCKTTFMKKSSIIFLAALFLGACASSKFNYKDAYKFSHYDYNKKAETETLADKQALVQEETKPKSENSIDFSEAEQPLASTEDRVADEPTPEKAIQKLADKLETHQKAKKDPKVRLSKEEKKNFRKEVKQDFKEIKQQVKELKQEEAKNVSMNQKVYIGIIIALAGLVIAILASTGIGALAIIVGVGLIAWGLIEQGAF